MSRCWWMRPGAPSDEEIAREIRAHVERLEAEEIAAGAAPDDARRRARERFGDEDDVAAGMRRAWEGEPLGTWRIGMQMTVATAVAFLVFALNTLARAVERGAGLTSCLFLLPAIVVLAIPLGAATGAAVAAAGPRFTRSGPVLHRATVARIVGLAAVATLACFGAYLAVPGSNARCVDLARQGAGMASSAGFPGVRCIGIPALAALADVGARPPDAVSRLTVPQRERLAAVARFELQKRVALPVACLVLALAGMACGAWLRRLRLAPALAVVVASAVSLGWYAIGAAAAAHLAAAPSSAALLAWSPNLAVLTLTGVALAVLRHSAPGHPPDEASVIG